MPYMETSLEKTVSGVLLLNSSSSVTLTWCCTWATGLIAAKGLALCECALSGLEAVALHTDNQWQQDLYFTYMSHLLKCIFSTFSLSSLSFFCDDEWLIVFHLLCTSPESIDSLAVFFQNSKLLNLSLHGILFPSLSILFTFLCAF